MILSIASTLIQILLILPFIFAARQKNRSTPLTPLFYFIGLYLFIDILMSSLVYTRIFPHEHWRWAGKIAAFVIELMFAFTIPAFDRKDFGVTTKINWTGAKPLLSLCAIYFLIRVALYLFSGEATAKIHSENVLFQATLPGLQEELLFRGLLLGLLNRMLPAPSWTFCKVSFGWGAIITSILFGLSHGIILMEGYAVHFNYFLFLRTTIDGFLFALLVEKTKSIFPGVIFHNALNLIGIH